MRKAGRALLPLIAAIVIVGLGLFVFLLAGSSPSVVASDFMVALGKGDAMQLSKLSYIEGNSPEQIRAAWDKTLDRAKYFRFYWRIKTTTQPAPDQATVSMDVQKNADLPSSYPEDFSLNLVEVDGKWKVDVRQISRDMFPALPR